MPATTITITSEQRDGLYELVRNHLGSAGDLVDLLEQQKDWGKAEQLSSSGEVRDLLVRALSHDAVDGAAGRCLALVARRVDDRRSERFASRSFTLPEPARAPAQRLRQVLSGY